MIRASRNASEASFGQGASAPPTLPLTDVDVLTDAVTLVSGLQSGAAQFPVTGS